MISIFTRAIIFPTGRMATAKARAFADFVEDTIMAHF
jgi:hypothetical protein